MKSFSNLVDTLLSGAFSRLGMLRKDYSYDGNAFGNEVVLYEWHDLRVRFVLDRGEPRCDIAGTCETENAALGPFGPWIGINEIESLLSGQETVLTDCGTYMRSVLTFLSDHQGRIQEMFAPEHVKGTITLVLEYRRKAVGRFRKNGV